MGILFGKNARKQVRRGDLIASFQYVNGEPAFCMWRLATLGKEEGGAGKPSVYVICLSAAFKYMGQTREEVAYLVKQSMVAAQVMGFEPSKFITKRISDFIQDMLIELVNMKPEPEAIAKDRFEKSAGSIAAVELKDGRAKLVLH